jgi:two-component system C4-dicarboxylate transport sensor histidine kinase DctB
VRGGKVRLEQVLVNLIQNAIEALSGRADGRVRLAIDADDTTVRLTVTDNGPGIAPDIGERLFTPFVTSRANGLGLGLVIAQDIMADMSGGLRLLPSDQGARFEMELSRA